MDIMHIESKFATNAISKIMMKVLRKQFGYNVDIELNKIDVETINEEQIVHIHADADAKISKEELSRILQKAGLD